MKIRKATFHDAPFLKLLLGDRQLTVCVSELITRMNTGFGNEDDFIIVYEDREEVIGFAAVHYLPRLSGTGYILLVSELVTRERLADTSAAGLALKHYISQLAEKQNCQRIEWLGN